MPNKNKLKVLITGGSSGIGESLVRSFAKEGYEIWATFSKGKSRAKSIEKSLLGSKVKFVQMDQGSNESIDHALSLLPENLDIVVFNAAIGTVTSQAYGKTIEAQDLALFTINALGPMWLTKKLIPRLGKAGKLIYLSSVDGGINYFSGARYADGMSKAALTHFTKQLAAELVHSNLDIFTVCPGATETPMLAASQLSHLSKEDRKKFCEALPGGRLISPDEISKLIAFLCSPAGRILRGTVIDASLGLGNSPNAIKRTKYKGDK